MGTGTYAQIVGTDPSGRPEYACTHGGMEACCTGVRVVIFPAQAALYLQNAPKKGKGGYARLTNAYRTRPRVLISPNFRQGPEVEAQAIFVFGIYKLEEN